MVGQTLKKCQSFKCPPMMPSKLEVHGTFPPPVQVGGEFSNSQSLKKREESVLVVQVVGASAVEKSSADRCGFQVGGIGLAVVEPHPPSPRPVVHALLSNSGCREMERQNKKMFHSGESNPGQDRDRVLY